MSTIVTYDDRDSIVRYSQPASGHHWTDQYWPESYQGTLRLTNTRRASATVTFTGTSITVWGLVSDRGLGADPVSSYSIDGGSSTTFAPGRTGNNQARIQFFKSDPLENRQHVLEIVNLVEGDFLWIDSFDVTRPIVSNNPPASPPANPPANPPSSPSSSTPQTTSRTPAPNPSPSPVSSASPSPTPVRQVTTSRTQVVTTVIQATVVIDGSSTVTSYSTSLSTTSLDVNPTEPPVSNIMVASQQEKSNVPVGVIVGGVIGGLVIIILAVIIFLLLRRKGKQNFAASPLSPPPTASAWSQPYQHQQSTTERTMQGHVSNPYFTSTNNFTSERTDPSSTSPNPFPSTIQPSTTNGLPALGRVLPPNTEPIGKRQMMHLTTEPGTRSPLSSSTNPSTHHRHTPSSDSSIGQSEADRSRILSPMSAVTGSNSNSSDSQGFSTRSEYSISSDINSTVHTSIRGATGYPEVIMEESPPAYSPKHASMIPSQGAPVAVDQKF